MPPACLVAVLAVATGWLAPPNAKAQQSYPLNPAIYAKLSFDPLTDFAPVANIGAQDIVLMVHPSVAANSMQELIALAKARSGGLDWAVTTWNGVFAPVATPREIVRRLNAEINGLLVDPGFKAKVLAGSMIEAAGGSPEEFAAFLKADRERFAEVAKRAAIRMD
jgi:tripartite-type tricarboxylate transporter receptor subunit TctC